MNFVNEILFRLKTSSPSTFQKIQKWSWILLLLFAVSWTLNKMAIYTLPDDINTVLIALIFYFFGTGTTAALPVDSKGATELEEKKQESADK